MTVTPMGLVAPGWPGVVGVRKAVTAGGGGGAFDPATLSLDLWYDPSDLSTLKQSSGGSAVAADGDVVGWMHDKGAGVSDQTQGTSTKKPIYKTSGGKSWLLSDGVDDEMAGGAISSFVGATAFDLFAAFRFVGSIPGSSADLTAYGNPGLLNTANGYIWLTASTAAPNPHLQPGLWDGTARVVPISNAAFAADLDVVVRLTLSGTQLAATLNKTIAGTPTASGAPQALTQPLTMFTRNGSTAFAAMRLYGMVARKTVFSTTEANNIWTYLASKTPTLTL